MPASEIGADFAAQRIKNLSLFKAVINSLLPFRNKKNVTSLIEEFQYPKFGPGMMWERCRDLIVESGATVAMETSAVGFEHFDGKVHRVVAEHAGELTYHEATHVVSSMPLPQLVEFMRPTPPDEVVAAARGLRFRDFLTVALVVPEEDGFPDNWIYVHSPEVRLGRVQNFGQWSPFMVKPPDTCLGLEYFVNEDEDLWAMEEHELVALGTAEMAKLGLLDPDRVKAGYVVRMPKAYPMYDANYKANVGTLRAWLDEHASNVFPVGRNGMHRYNNQDHSMYTAMLSVENMFGANHDIWSVNVDEDYHEERSTDS